MILLSSTFHNVQHQSRIFEGVKVDHISNGPVSQGWTKHRNVVLKPQALNSTSTCRYYKTTTMQLFSSLKLDVHITDLEIEAVSDFYFFFHISSLVNIGM